MMKSCVRLIFVFTLVALCCAGCVKRGNGAKDAVPSNSEDTVAAVQDTVAEYDSLHSADTLVVVVHAMGNNANCDYITSCRAVERKKRAMLTLPNGNDYFEFLDATLRSQNSHTCWLANRMMHMVRQVTTADDGWAWMLAMNKSIVEYYHRLNLTSGSVDTAINAIFELTDTYAGGSMAEINIASYVCSMLTYYNTIYAYYDFIESLDDYGEDKNVALRALYYREFQEWFNLTNAANGLKSYYTYADASYSMAPMESNIIFSDWVGTRLSELITESNIYGNTSSLPFRCSDKNITVEEFDKILHFFSQVSGDELDHKKIDEMVRQYATALTRWREVRKQIAEMYPENKQQSYREITKQIHTRLYNDLLDLKEHTIILY